MKKIIAKLAKRLRITTQQPHWRQAGGSIIEILIATLIVATVITAIIAGLSLSSKNTAEVRQRTLARQIAQEGIESFRSTRQQWGWADFFQEFTAGEYCYAIGNGAGLPENIVLTEGECPEETALAGIGLTRKVTIEKELGSDPDDESEQIMRIRVIVSWVDGDTNRTVEVAQTFRSF